MYTILWNRQNTTATSTIKHWQFDVVEMLTVDSGTKNGHSHNVTYKQYGRPRRYNTKTITRLVSNKKYCIWIKCHDAVFGCASLFDSWTTAVLVGLNMYRSSATDWGQTKFKFGNIVPKRWTLSGFVQHTSANSIYKDDNKISQQQKVLHMNKVLECVQHFQTGFNVGIQPLS